MASRATNGTFRKVIKCYDCTDKSAVTALICYSGEIKDLCQKCALENGADADDLEEER